MSDLVDAVLEEREAMDRGFPVGLMFSAVMHAAVIGLALILPALFPERPMIRTVLGPIVAVRPGGGGTPEEAAPVAPAKTPPATEPVEEPPAPEPPKVAKAPVNEPERKKALPELDSKTKKPKATPAPPVAGPRGKPAPDKREARATAGLGGRGTNPNVPGLSIGPPGPGVPDGTDPFADWYLTSVQRKIWMIWTQQIKAGFTQPIGVIFTILADGSVTDVQVVDPSGSSQLDFAARRAIQSAAPFSPLPKEHGTRYTIQAVFRPIS